ncbi:unnamed protein product [Clonostachys rosea]|uniref:non-specific serine/threonine protein kinase n=1 Tax=Bionectria ochroleuca TaxID=29856 RepID=A0ABY6TYH6_BIOOC|nr:unnamed protein product [Clonostachys rosea]
MVRLSLILPLYRKAWPLTSAVASRLDPLMPVEEEKTPDYHHDRFFPARPGQVLNQRYQLATKLGYGANSTVWLARDLHRWRWSEEKYIAVKINATASSSRKRSVENEVAILQHISKLNPNHQGWHFIRKLSDSFNIEGKYGSSHCCLALDPLREPLWLYQRRYSDGVIPSGILKVLVQMMLHALDCLHSECRVIHTDLKPDNIMIKLEDLGLLEKDAQDEYDHPLPQKHIGDRIIYLSRNNFGPLRKPTGIIQLVDFDLSVSTKPGKLHFGPIQAEIYRAPEVILDSGYTFSADIWSLGVMLWDLLEGKSLFEPQNTNLVDEYDDATHLHLITYLIGPPPKEFSPNGQRSTIFYDSDGNLISGEEKRRFISFVKRMMKWRPEERSTAKELLDDPWLHEDFLEE